MKRLFSMLMAICLFACAFSGCGKDGDKDTGKKTETVNLFSDEYLAAREAYEKSKDPYGYPELKGTTVKFATWMDHTQDEAANAMATFEKTTGLKVEWVNVPQGGYAAKIASMIATDQAPDVYVENQDEFPMTLRIAQPINKISTFDINDPIWDADTIKAMEIDGNIYSVLTRYSVWHIPDLVFYNKKAFNDHGIMTPEDYIENDDWTFENMIKIMEDFVALGEGYTGGAVDGNILINAYGSSIVNLQDGKFVSGLEDEKLFDALKLYTTISEKKLSSGSPSKGLVKGTTGFYIIGPFGLKKNGYFKDVDPGVLGYAKLPKLGDGEQYYSYRWRSYGVVRGSKNPEGAVLFIRHYLDPKFYSYDTDTFIDENAAKFFIEECCEIPAESKRFDFSSGLASLAGNTKQFAWRSALVSGGTDQIEVNAAIIKNEVANGITKGNEILDECSRRFN